MVINVPSLYKMIKKTDLAARLVEEGLKMLKKIES